MRIAILIVVLLTTLIVAGCYWTISSSAASQNDFSSASNAITSAFLATHNAEEKGGNVSSLIGTLNEAASLVQRAQSENSSSPSLALEDLQNATKLAGKVSTDSVGVGESGAAYRSIRMTESLGTSAVIIASAILIYIFGGKIYRRAWFYLYKDYTVRPS